MDGSTTGEIETSENKHPTVCVPCPAGDGIVDEGGPDEDEDTARKHASSFRGGADSEGGGNCREHTLENSEGEIRNIAGLLCQNTLETEVVEVTDEGTRSLGEGEGISPEEPLIQVST